MKQLVYTPLKRKHRDSHSGAVYFYKPLMWMRLTFYFFFELFSFFDELILFILLSWFIMA